MICSPPGYFEMNVKGSYIRSHYFARFIIDKLINAESGRAVKCAVAKLKSVEVETLPVAELTD